jgi:hypothetical protein
MVHTCSENSAPPHGWERHGTRGHDHDHDRRCRGGLHEQHHDRGRNRRIHGRDDRRGRDQEMDPQVQVARPGEQERRRQPLHVIVVAGGEVRLQPGCHRQMA